MHRVPDAASLYEQTPPAQTPTVHAGPFAHPPGHAPPDEVPVVEAALVLVEDDAPPVEELVAPDTTQFPLLSHTPPLHDVPAA